MSKKVERKGSFKSISGDELKDFYSSSNKEKNYNIDPGSFPYTCLLYTSPSPRDLSTSRMPSSA